MQGLGATHIEQIKYKHIGLTGSIAATFGNLPEFFRGVIFGENGSGKTELAFNLVRELQKCDRVDWVSYEQGHGPDLQDAIIRHHVRAQKWDCVFFDPFKKRNRELTLFQEFMKHASKKNSAKFFIMDSCDACGFTIDEFHEIHETFGKKKGFAWLSYEGGNKKPKTALARQIGGEGDFIIRVHKCIATVVKNRHHGFADYITYEERARQLNPMYFEELDRKKQLEAKRERRSAKLTTKAPKPVAQEPITPPAAPVVTREGNLITDNSIAE